ncbi:hypothetical protein RD792_009631 [Penstemon davidsonii]|uniref:At4g14310 8-bladed propeller domain-containing protein n=1 Tax=Penstemon davidsonii TaxID=160366 RepID=A0ABR0D0Z9_9LAMI|nr:hypothetical protein RD792_009631 [Penstemon davidsonii]
MSTSSVRRMKERGEGGKVTSAVTGKISPVVTKSVSTGKENPRPTSRPRAASQKPNIRPMARIDKSAASAMEEPRSRWSTSSVPRGRSSSPSEFTRALSDIRKNSSSRVSVGPPQKKLNTCNSNERSGEKCNLDKRVSKDLEKNGGICDVLKGRSQSNEKIQVRALKDSDSEKKERSLGSNSSKRSDLGKRVFKDSEKNERSFEELIENCQDNGKFKIGVLNGSNEKKEGVLSSISDKSLELENFKEKSSLDVGVKIKSSEEVKLRSSGGRAEVGSSVRESKMVSKVSAYQKENGTNKHPSKLHEKLAFLEGKVKRIASDIKRTKEMLDMNNPDASKMILSDIQEKISGIEKAMGHVAGNDGDAKMGLVKTDENKDNEEKKELVDAKSLVKGLNVEELEARLFPHHKLIRDRTLSKTTSGSSETNSSKLVESSSSFTVEEEKITSSDDNAIALEFLASLSKGETNVVVEDSEVQEVDDLMNSGAKSSSLNVLNDKANIDDLLMADENLNEFDDERMPAMIIDEDVEEDCTYQLSDIGCKTSTGGWFVSEGESILLAHDDGSCSFYDIANCEEKAEYKPPAGVSPNMWRDCWIIRAPSTDGCSGRYVVAASAGNSVDSGFCSWDFYTKKVHSFHLEDETSNVRTALAPLSNNTMHRRNTLSTIMATENRQWWYKPCGPLMISTASCQRMVQIFDIRDGDHVMKWELQKPVLAMDNSSPLQWRNRGKVVLAESDGISLWDVSSQSSQALMSVSSSGRKISALHVNNTDAELGGGVRQRISSSEAEGNDGFFCTPDFINVLDFRHPSGIAFKIPNIGVSVQSGSARGDSIYIGCSSLRSTLKKQSSSQIQQFSMRKQRLFSTYALPELNAHHHFKALTQVWGNSSYVMGVCGLGLYVFDSLKDEGLPLVTMDYGNTQNVKEVIGPDDMYYPSFDYLSSRVLLISRDRPARWRYLF